MKITDGEFSVQDQYAPRAESAHAWLREWLGPLKADIRDGRRTPPTPCSASEPHQAQPARLASGRWGAVTFHPDSERLWQPGTIASLRIQNRAGYVFERRAVCVAVAKVAAHWDTDTDAVAWADWDSS